MIWNMPYIVVAVLIGLGLYAMLFKHNLIKMVIGLSLIENGVNLFLIALGFRKGAVAPIYTYAARSKMVLPTVQALTLTAIVIGLATTALMLSFVIMIYRHYGTIESTKVRRLRG